MSKNTLILTAIIAMFGLVGFGSDAFAQVTTTCNDKSGRCITTEIGDLTGRTFQNECVASTDPAYNLEVLEGESKFTDIEKDLSDNAEIVHSTYTVSGTAVDGNGCLYTISDKGSGMSQESGSGDQGVEREILHLHPKNPKCGIALFSMEMEIEIAGNGDAVELNKLTCAGGPTSAN